MAARSDRNGRPATARVGVDATALGLGKGIARYVRELLPALARVDSEIAPVVLAQPGVELPSGAETLETVGVRGRPAIVWEQVELARVARTRRLALVHTTTDRIPLVPAAPIVVYLFEDPKYRLEAARGTRTPKKLVADLLTETLFPISMRRAARVLVSSQATARDLRARGIPDDRIRLVYPGVSDAFRPALDDERRLIREQFGEPDGYVLHLSSGDVRDNTGAALRVFAELCRRCGADAPRLLVAGGGREEAVAESLGIAARVRWLGYLSDEEIRQLYRGAIVYLDPSLYEGFGFQVLEALASGVPVVCSDATSLPEVVGDAGILAPPTDVRALADALEQVVSDDELRRRLADRGREQAARFSWGRSAEETVDCWSELLGSGASL